MKALILAAGEGTRLRPLTAHQPKPMLPLGDQPLLEHIIRLLKVHGIMDIAINLHYKPQAITSYFEDGKRWGVNIQYSFEERLLGSAGAAKRLEWFFDDSFVVYYGDVYTEMDLSGLVKAHRQQDALATIALYTVDNPTECGIVELDDQGRVRRFMEKPAPDQVFSRLANAGIFVTEPEVLSDLPADRFIDFGHAVFPRLLASGHKLIGYPTTSTLIDIGTPQKYQKAQRLISEKAQTQSIMEFAR